MRIVGCFLEYDGKFLVLLRHSHKPHGNTWGLPGGKVEPGETDDQAVLRELEEETGYSGGASQLELLGVFDFLPAPDTPYEYVTYRIKIDDHHEVRLEDSAHSDYKWLTPQECYAKSDLIHDLHDLLKMVGYID